MSTRLFSNEPSTEAVTNQRPEGPTGRRMPKAVRNGIIAVLVLALVAAVVLVRARQARAKAQLHFETANVDRGRITAKVTASGTLSAIVTVQVGSQVSGRIAELHADFNTPVRKGELIAKIDPQLFQAAVAQAQANFAAAQGNLAKAKAQAIDAERQYRRTQELAARKLVALADLDTAQANMEVAKAQVDASAGSVAQARASLNQAEVNLAYTNIVSPTDGVVISRNVDVGQTVAASLQAPTLFLIAEDLQKMQVDTSVAEADVGRLAQGMRATFTVDAYPNDRFVGTVRQIRNAPQTVQSVVTYDAVIDVDNAGLKLKPGMTANVTFIYAEKDDTIRVPNAALRFRPSPDVLAKLTGAPAAAPGAGGGGGRQGARGPGQGGQRQGGGQWQGRRGQDQAGDRRTVWVSGPDGKARPVQIRTGVTDGSFTEVVEGDLHEGDAVITDVTGGGANGQAQSAPAGGFRRMF